MPSNCNVNSAMNHLNAPDMKIVFWNIYGYKNLSDVSYYVDDATILCLSETWLSDNPNHLIKPFTHAISSPALRNSKFGRASGDLLILYNSKYCKVESLVINPNYIFCKIKSVYISFILISVHFPPRWNIDDYLLEFEQTYSLIQESYPNLPFFIGGDFNCRVKDANNNKIILKNTQFEVARLTLDNFFSDKSKSLLDSFESYQLFLLNGRSRNDNPSVTHSHKSLTLIYSLQEGTIIY